MNFPMENIAAELADRYRLLRELGSGGMATVHLAEDLKHHRLVAIKVLRSELAFILGPERFQREIRLAARLQHPNILPVFDSGAAAGQLWFTMPYVEGETLRGRMERESQLPLDDALQIASEVAAALDHAHQQGVIHRDIKPENILLSGGHAVVADFGIARALDAAGSEKLTETGLALGTPTYMSPEQASGTGRLDGRSDIYALGAMLYEMLAGVPPFTGPTSQAVLARHMVDPVPSLRTVRTTVPDVVEAAITKAMAKVPADRFASAAEFVAALTQPRLPAMSSVARGRRMAIPAALAVIVLVAAGALLFWSFGRNRTVNTNLVAVAPFRVNAAQPALGFLREGMIDLLSATFNGENGPRTVEPRSVVGVWNRASSSGADPDEAESLRLAQKLGAGALVLGSIVGNGSRVSLQARLLDVPSGRVRGQATIEGEPDSLVSALVDRLAAQLLGLKAGVERRRLLNLTSTSLPAVHAFLRGQADFRKGRFDDAQRAFREALDIDSTFALAALALGSSVATDGDDRGVHLAWTYRAKLSPADRTLAEARAGPAYPFSSTRVEAVAAWEAAAAANPDRAEVWYGLGDNYYHSGTGIGLTDALARADSAFRRGQALDSLAKNRDLPDAPEAIGHMMELAAMNRDSARARRLMAGARAADSTMNSPAMRWLLAHAVNDSVALDSLRRHPELFIGMNYDQLFTFSQWNGIGTADVENVTRYWLQRDGAYRGRLRLILFNGGRPAEAMALDTSAPSSIQAAQNRIYEALFWDGDTAAARQAATVLGAASEAPIGVSSSRIAMINTLYFLEQWRISQGQTGTASGVIGRLRGDLSANASPYAKREAAYFANVLEAWLQVETRHPEAIVSLNRVDSIARGRWPDPSNLILARLYEKSGDPRSALRAVRRGGGPFGLNMALLSTFLREEGRLAVLSGDRAEAIRAYQHYLALRWNPEPAIKPEVDGIRRELARLVGERR